jgi:hypothetical protein
MFKTVLHVYILNLIFALLSRTQDRIYSAKASWECVIDARLLWRAVNISAVAGWQKVEMRPAAIIMVQFIYSTTSN